VPLEAAAQQLSARRKLLHLRFAEPLLPPLHLQRTKAGTPLLPAKRRARREQVTQLARRKPRCANLQVTNLGEVIGQQPETGRPATVWQETVIAIVTVAAA